MLKRLLTSIAAVMIVSVGAFASEAPKNPKKLTPQGKYLSPKEALDMKKKEGNKVLFIDVRTPEELYFVGYPTVIDKNIPLILIDYGRFKRNKNGKTLKYADRPNKKFLADFKDTLKERGLGKDAPVILMCRSGHRAAKAAKILNNAGYKNVYNLDQGFEGDKDAQKHRTVNGWKNAGLPYTYKVDEKIFTLVN